MFVWFLLRNVPLFHVNSITFNGLIVSRHCGGRQIIHEDSVTWIHLWQDGNVTVEQCCLHHIYIRSTSVRGCIVCMESLDIEQQSYFFLAVRSNRGKPKGHKCHIPQTIVWIILPGSSPSGFWPWLPVFTALRGLKVLAWWIYCWHLTVLKGRITNGWPWGSTVPDPRRSSLTPPPASAVTPLFLLSLA